MDVLIQYEEKQNSSTRAREHIRIRINMHPCSDHYDEVDEEWAANEWDYNLERECEKVLGPEGAADAKDSGGARSVKDLAYYDLLKVWST